MLRLLVIKSAMRNIVTSPLVLPGNFLLFSAAPLDAWHLAQDFGALPTLSSSFIQEAPPVARVIADDSDAHFLLDVWHELFCERPMPVYSVPGFVDHF